MEGGREWYLLEEDQEDQEDQEERDANAPAEAPPPPYPALRRRGNTGPKGVLADYAEFEQQRVQAMQADKDARRAWWLRESITLRTTKEEDKDEKEEWEALRAKRLKDLKAAAQRPSFGRIRTVHREEYVNAVECEPEYVLVVVHLFEDYVDTCVCLDQSLALLAQEVPHVKFLRIRARDAKEDFDDLALPTLLLYKGGDLVDALLRATDNLGKTFEMEDVRELLETSSGAWRASV